MSIKTILAAMALVSENDPVGVRAVQLARQHGARLVIVHVIEDPIHLDQDPPLPGGQAAIRTARCEEAKATIRGQLKSLAWQMGNGEGQGTEIIVKAGNAFEVIDRVAGDCGADLVVIGPGKAANLRERMFGSTADRLLRSADCPVLVVRRDGTRAYDRVLVAMDFSDTADAAARSAYQLVPTARMDLGHAVEIPLGFEQAMRKTGTSQAEIDAYRRERARAAHKALLKTAKTLERDEAAKIRTAAPRPCVVQGRAGNAILRLAYDNGADLIAIGAHGGKVMSRLVLGSVARRVLSLAEIDVLVMPHGAVPGNQC